MPAQKQREYLLYMNRPLNVGPGDRGFPGQWSPESFDETDQLPDIPTETKREEAMSEMKPIPFAGLAEIQHKETVRCVEGRLKSLYALETKTKDGKPLEYPKRKGVLTDLQNPKLEHRIEFAQDCGGLTDALKGKNIRVSCNIGTKGLSGIKMDRWSDNPKYHTISVTKSAHIEIIGANGQPTTAPRQESTTSQSTEPERPHRQETQTHQPMEQQQSAPPGHQSDPYEVRAAGWWRGLETLCRITGHDFNAVKQGLSADKLAEINTGIIISFKDGYIYQRPHFVDDAGAEETKARNEAAVGKAQAATASDGATASPTPTTSGDGGWREYVYSGKKLGELEPGEMVKLMAWADTKRDNTKPNVVELRNHIDAAAAELTPKASHKMSSILAKNGLGQSFDEEDVKLVCQKRYSADFGKLTYPDLLSLFNDKDAFFNELRASFTARHAQPKTPTRARIDDDDDMPGTNGGDDDMPS